MKKLPSIVIIAAAIIGLLVLIWPREKSSESKSEHLVCYVGGTMTPVFNALAAEYRKQSGAVVDITSADSGELLATIEMLSKGDLYVAHDPFMDIAMRRGFGVNAWCLGELSPVMIVQKGNPKNIKTLKDLMRPDVSVYLTDYRHSTLGQILPVIFDHAGVSFAGLNSSKKIPTHRSGSWVANQIIMKSADAAIVWQVVAKLRAKDLDTVSIADILPRPGIDAVSSATGKKYDVAPVKVEAVSLTCSKKPKDVEKFIEFITSETGKRIFVENGFNVSDLYGKREYINGVRQK
jgi:molybdate transport system substrate-binding protein